MQHAKTLLACMAATLLFSCTKKDEESKTPDPKPVTSKAVGSWKTIAKVADRPVYHWNTIEYVTDLWDREEECVKDNLLILKADGTGLGDEGATKCKESDAQSTPAGTWKESDGKLTYVDSDGETDSYTIDRLDDSIMVLTGQTWYAISEVRYYYNATTTYRRQ